MNAQIPRWAWFLWFVPLFIWLVSSLFFTNKELFYLLNEFFTVIPIPVLAFFNFLGNAFGIFALTLFLLLNSPRVFVSGLVAAIISGLLGRIIKEILALPRPAGLLDQSTFFILGSPLTGLSMPSGHTLTAFSVATAYFFSIAPDKRKPYVILFVIASLTALSRIAVGAHWPNDIFVGASIGIFSGVISVKLSSTIPSKWLQLNSWLVYFLLVGSCVGIYMLLNSEIDFSESYIFQLMAAFISTVTLAVLLRRIFQVRSDKSS